MKYCQLYHRYNHKFKPIIEEKIYVWFEWNVDDQKNINRPDSFQEAKDQAYHEQRPSSWGIPLKGSQKENMALGAKHDPELSWSTIMECGVAYEFTTPVYKRRK